jgi:hypothetical protein
MGAAVIAQCPACRALGLVGAVVVDGSRDADGAPRAGLPCGACGAVAWLPLSTTVAAGTGPVSPSWPSLPPPSLAALPSPSSRDAAPAQASSSPPVVEAAPAPVSTALAAAFDDETLRRIRARVDTAPSPSPTQQPLAERFEALLTTKWQNEAEHKGLLKMAAVAGELAFVGSRYRAVLDVVRDEPRARAAQGELLTMAMATMSTSRVEQAPEGPGRAKLIAAALLMLAIGGGVFFFIRKMMASMAAGGGVD